MKTQNNNFYQPLGQTQLNHLVKEVKETIASGTPIINNQSVFGIVDLWNLERSKRSRMVRKHLAF